MSWNRFELHETNKCVYTFTGNTLKTLSDCPGHMKFRTWKFYNEDSFTIYPIPNATPIAKLELESIYNIHIIYWNSKEQL